MASSLSTITFSLRKKDNIKKTERLTIGSIEPNHKHKNKRKSLLSRINFVSLSRINISKDMKKTVLNPTQLHLLKLFSVNDSESYAKEIQMVLTNYFQQKLEAEADRLWDAGILNQEKLDEIRQTDLHAQ